MELGDMGLVVGISRLVLSCCCLEGEPLLADVDTAGVAVAAAAVGVWFENWLLKLSAAEWFEGVREISRLLHRSLAAKPLGKCC